MKNRRILTLCAALLAVLMLLPFASCTNPGNGTETSTTVAGTAEVTTEPEETNTLQKSGLEIRDYSGKEMKIWYSSGSVWSPRPLYVEEDEGNSGDLVLESGYKRNNFLENTLKLKLNYVVSNSNPNGTGATADLALLRALNSSGDIREFDMVMTGATPAGQLALENFYLDISDSDYIKTDADYYENRMNSQLLFYGHQFFAAGYYSIMNTACIDVTYVNTGMIRDAAHVEIGDLYDLALNRKWTLETLLELAKPCATLDQNTGDIYHDKYGLILSNNYCQNIFYDLGGTVLGFDQSGNEMIVTASDDKNNEVWGYMQAHLTKQNGVELVKNDNHTTAFLAEAAPFMIVTYNNLFKLSEATFDWAMLPTPMIAEGGDYHAYSDAWNLNFAGIPAGCADTDKAEYLYEAFMCTSYDYVYPAYYETCFGTRYQPDATGSIIFDMMNKSRVICLGNILGIASSVNGIVSSVHGGAAYASALKGLQIQLNARVKQLNSDYSK